MSDTIKALTETVRGRVITASDPDYDDAPAFGHRDKSFALVIVGTWPDPADNEANTRWVRDYSAATHPHSGSEGGINFMSGDDDHRAAENDGADYERLSAVKAAYDPDNLFHLNQNIASAKGR